MESKSKIVGMTLLSALVFCVLLVVNSMSPLSEMGNHANTLGSVGMWAAIGIGLVCYAIPLFIYSIGVKWMKYVLAVLCGIGMFTFLAIASSAVFIGLVQHNFSQLIGVLVISVIASVINILWFVIAFRTKRKAPSVIIN
ncbi:putative Tic20 family protein [Pullulanibacillus pueri]|uniref:DUF5391 family protein n=1 Tax=Pullulanibacillus pueri TaxID=1437324 RepID=A0A8J2ZU26_9BACL|nr:DUF5391 family protein [Pullulanibacillus pueri]MBM7680842.1 putative Tic20 family protein [Pullulanibacillus pueri]GGH78542.1 hypothetical protein GCM10007096_12130 [Pullulanibacillus pueri]